MATRQELLQEYGITIEEAMEYCTLDQIQSLPAKELNGFIWAQHREEDERRRITYEKEHPYYMYQLCCFDEEAMVILADKYNIDNLKKYNVINVTAYNKTLDNLYKHGIDIKQIDQKKMFTIQEMICGGIPSQKKIWDAMTDCFGDYTVYPDEYDLERNDYDN